MAMEALGATITLEEGYVIAEAPKGGLVGGNIHFEKVSVGATENALMAAVLAKGTTTITNAAREPEVSDLANMLVSMGADISGIGSETITIRGVTALSGTSYRIIPDLLKPARLWVARWNCLIRVRYAVWLLIISAKTVRHHGARNKPHRAARPK